MATPLRCPRCYTQLIPKKVLFMTYWKCPIYPDCKTRVHIMKRSHRALKFARAA